MVSKALITLALVAILSACTVERETYLIGTEAKAIEMCKGNGGVRRIEIATNSDNDLNGYWHSKLTVYCNNDNFTGSVWVKSFGTDQSIKGGVPNHFEGEPATQ